MPIRGKDAFTTTTPCRGIAGSRALCGQGGGDEYLYHIPHGGIIATGAALFLAFLELDSAATLELARGHGSELRFGWMQHGRVMAGMLHICLGIYTVVPRSQPSIPLGPWHRQLPKRPFPLS